MNAISMLERKDKLKFIGILGLVLLVLLVGGRSFLNKANTEAIHASETFIRSVIEGDKETALALSKGMLKFNISNNELKASDYKLLSMDHSEGFGNKKIASIVSRVEFKNETDFNMVWYEISLKNENGWKVYSMEEVNPDIPHKQSNQANITTIEKVFMSYIESIQDGDFKGAAKYLVGKAKRMHTQTSELLQKSNLIKGIEEMTSEVLYSTNEIAIVNFSYKNNNQDISVVVYFHLTAEGWKIYNVQQL